MIYMDLEKFYKETGIPNKYDLTLVIAARARQLSERKDPTADEKYISRAVEEVEHGRVAYSITELKEK